jgi:hypothetical protein
MQAQVFESKSPDMIPPIAVPRRRRDDAAVAELITGYVAKGGLASTDEVISLMRPYWRQPISVLAKWIVGRKVVSFTLCTQFLLPIFQFARPRMTPSQVVADCSIELGEFMDDQAFATWFVRPCEWLDWRMPIDLIANSPEAVVDAATRSSLASMTRRMPR